MLFPRTDRWRCQLQRHHIQLYQGNRLQEQQSWQPDMPLAEQLDHMLSHLHCRLPWQNSIGFELDTPHISYLLTPWSQGIVTPAELRQYTRKLLAEQHGTAVQDNMISFIGPHYGANAFAAALDPSLFNELKAAAKRHRLRFRGCSTPFSRMLGMFGNTLPSEALFACISKDEGNFAARYQGRWHSIFSLNLPTGESVRHLDIANLLVGLPPLERYVMHTQQETSILKKQLPPAGTKLLS
ncbi:hypothetical protein HW114_01870 [Serratia symbiotica]|uniref:hypothetical protein n=1 Tax=Serratia symbiotica TaxID=138074 RepID=UPI0013218657|nr:hypothetical protein [Serratia symbiotica]MBF1994356.1 hypothetical protein [Serratia symbiotica]MBQ0954822.1 hypothetical protein [Serratia symbiotica]QTP14275.1 hypothetical protein GPZ83_0013135 [Serratia symbiotica]